MNIYCKVVNDVNLTVILIETKYFSISYFFNKFCFIDFKCYTQTGIKWECKSCFRITKTLISEYELYMWYRLMIYLPLCNEKRDEVILGDDSFIIYFSHIYQLTKQSIAEKIKLYSFSTTHQMLLTLFIYHINQETCIEDKSKAAIYVFILQKSK